MKQHPHAPTPPPSRARTAPFPPRPLGLFPSLLPALLLLLMPAPRADADAASAAPAPADPAGIIPATPLIKMEKLDVTGSRLRLGGSGPSPVTIYDAEQIRATGAMNLADFLGRIPQVYNGVSAGRNSSPDELNPEFGQRTESLLPSFDMIMGAAAAPPGQTGVSGVSLRGLGAGSTLVLVDGRRVAHSGMGNRSTDSRQDFVNINNIPLGMIERIEIITDSASAIHGADGVGGVLNIITKKNYTGTTATFHLTAPERGGGGGERSLTLTSGFAKGKWRGMLVLDYYKRDVLKAADRPFSREQDHSARILGYTAAGTPVRGTDLRLNYGYPAVVQSRAPAPLAGVTTPEGNPTGIALVKDGADGLGPGSFAGQNTTTASRARRANTAAFLDIVPRSEREGLYAIINRTLAPDTEIRASYRYAKTTGIFHTQPPVSSAAFTSGFGNISTLIPAAQDNNPFGQDVAVGLVHHGFGSITQQTRTTAHDLLLAATGRLAATWQWDAGLDYQHQTYDERTRNFNKTGITAALTHPDPALRLNPFADLRATDTTAIYEPLAYYNPASSTSDALSLDLNATGELLPLWGGPATAALGLVHDYNKSARDSTNNDPSAAPADRAPKTSRTTRRTTSAYGEIALPLFGRPNALPLLHTLALHLAARLEHRDDVGPSGLIPKIGLTWSPEKSLLLRASYSKGYRAPHLTEYQTTEITSTGQITDPKRGGTQYSTTIVRGSNPHISAEDSHSHSAGIIYQPAPLKGLQLMLDYYDVRTDGSIQSLSAAQLVANETLFPDRVTRAPLTPDDQALGHTAGLITRVDQVFINFGKTIRRNLDLAADYTLPWETHGRWRLTANASRLLASRRELRPGQPAIDEVGDTFAPAKWRLHGTLYWNKKPWAASLRAEYQDSFKTNTAGNTFDDNTTIVTTRIPGYWVFDAIASHEFPKPFLGKFGRGVRLTLGIRNLLDQAPPFANTVFGFNAGVSNLALGRNYHAAIEIPF